MKRWKKRIDAKFYNFCLITLWEVQVGAYVVRTFSVHNIFHVVKLPEISVTEEC